jgi:hypothetical protein
MNVQGINAEKINVIFVCTPEDDKSPFDTFYKTVNTHPDIKNLITVYGADRATTANGFKKLCTEKNIIHEPIALPRTDMDRLKNLSREELNALDIKSVEPESMSASFVRKMGENALKDKFEDLYDSLLESSDIERLYTLISDGLQLPSKKEAEKLKSEAKKLKSATKTKKKGGKRKSTKRKSIKRKRKSIKRKRKSTKRKSTKK